MGLNKAVANSRDEGFKSAVKELIERTQKELDELKAKKWPENIGTRNAGSFDRSRISILNVSNKFLS